MYLSRYNTVFSVTRGFGQLHYLLVFFLELSNQLSKSVQKVQYKIQPAPINNGPPLKGFLDLESDINLMMNISA